MRSVKYRMMAVFFSLLFLAIPLKIMASGDTYTEEGLLGYWNFNKPEVEEVLFMDDLEGYQEGIMPSSWTLFGGECIVSSHTAYSGKYSIKVEDTSATAGAGLRTPKVKVEEGIYYTASCKYFNESGNSQVYLEFWDDANIRLTPVYIATNSAQGKWEDTTVSGIAPTGAIYATILVYSHVANVGISYHDDIKIIKSPLTRDVSGNGAHGTIHNGAEWVSGRWGNALSFNKDKDTYVEIPMSQNLKSLEAISIEAWIYPIPEHRETIGGIVNNINGFRESRLLVKNDGTLMAQPRGYKETIIGPKVTNEEWSHVVFVYDGKDEIFYLNGERCTSSPYSNPMQTGDNPLVIGKGHATTYNFNGLIDEVKIYGRALSPEEISYKYANPPMEWKDLVSHPNPFTSEDNAKVAYFVDGEYDVELFIYDESGREVFFLKDRTWGPGYYHMEWEGRDKNGNMVSPGIYLAVATLKEQGKVTPLARGLLIKVP